MNACGAIEFSASAQGRGKFPAFATTTTSMNNGGLANQLRRLPPPVALAIGILCGFLVARLLPWTTVRPPSADSPAPR